MPVHKIQGGYQYGNTGKKYYGKDAKKKAKLQELAIRLSGYKQDDEKKKRHYLKHEADSETIGREFVSEFFGDDHLAHHGIIGQKWGIRRFQPYPKGYKGDGEYVGKSNGKRQTKFYEKGGILKKGSTVYRMSNNKHDLTYDNKKYLSTSKKDREAWKKHLGDAYAKLGTKTYEVAYKTVKDIKIASETELGKSFLRTLMPNEKHLKRVSDDTNWAIEFLGYKPSSDSTPMDEKKIASLNIAAQTETGRRIVEELLRSGYEGVSDYHGRNVSEDPIIVFNPDTNLKKKKTKEYRSPYYRA